MAPETFFLSSFLAYGAGSCDGGIETFKIHSITNNSTINHNEKLKLSEFILYIFKYKVAEFQVSILVDCCEIMN